MKLYLRLCPREPDIPEKIIDAIGLSLPERSGVDTLSKEHSQHMPPSFPMSVCKSSVYLVPMPEMDPARHHISTLIAPR